MNHIESHYERDIYDMCICLMQGVYEDMLTYLDFMGVEYRDGCDEGKPVFSYATAQIVNLLFLWRTTHSGGTSAREKCREIGIDPYKKIIFTPEDDTE